MIKKLLKFLSLLTLKLFLALVLLYRYCLKFILVNEGCCYEPSCSVYMQQALKAHGPLKGALLGLHRVLRCHPWKKSVHMYDPVPSSFSIRKDFLWIRKKEI